MREITKIEEVHTVLLGIAQDFHKICKDNNIPYYMVYGTMLGTIRHNGFIPWDDDMDFAVEYKYYDKLKRVLINNLPPQYRCITRYNKEGAVGGFLKVEDTRTLVSEKGRLHSDENTGIFIDVFVLYPSDGKNNLLSRYSVIRLITLIQAYRFYSKSDGVWWKNLIGSVTKVLLFWLKKPTLITFMEKYLIPQEGNYLSTYSSIYGPRDLVHKNIYGEPEPYDFSGITLCGVACANDYLKQMYGNYKELPKESERHLHINNVYWR